MSQPEKPAIMNRQITDLEAFYFLNLHYANLERLEAEKEFFIKAGYDPQELYYLWDWICDDIQIVPKSLVIQNHATYRP